eukprot:scaffold124038_cov24-Attheya_sp.AAC.2
MDHSEAHLAKLDGGQFDFSDTVIHGWGPTGVNPRLIMSQAILVADDLACLINRILSGHILWGNDGMIQFKDDLFQRNGEREEP